MTDHDSGSRERDWFELFSRGSRDWLRHNQKVRRAVRDQVVDLASGGDVLSGSGDRTVQIPVRFLEHYRFRLTDPEQQEGVGQGEVEPGDVLRPGRAPGEGGKGKGGSGDGGLEFVLEFKVDELVDWLWEELKLPNLEPRIGGITDEEYQREGWDRRGARSRLDRRRTIKEAVKRRAVQQHGPAFTNEDLRYKQLVKRPRPTTRAVVFFALDVSSSVTEKERRLAKTFFFWALQGLRRQYSQIETVFIAHTVQAWEFPEPEFFQVRATGGTVASTAFNKVLEAVDSRYPPNRYNIYMFYASDGENFSDDRAPAMDAMRRLAEVASFIGYAETGQTLRADYQTETSHLFGRLEAGSFPVANYQLNTEEDIWSAIRHFFRRQAEDEHEVA